MNYVHLVGRLGDNPNIHSYSDDKQPADPDAPRRQLVRFDLAVERRWSAKAAKAKSERPVDWVPVLIFDGPAARYAEQALAKGDLVSITGRVDVHRWRDGTNHPRKEVRVVVGEIRKLAEPGAAGGSQSGANEPPAEASAGVLASAQDGVAAAACGGMLQ